MFVGVGAARVRKLFGKFISSLVVMNMISSPTNKTMQILAYIVPSVFHIIVRYTCTCEE